MAPKADSPEWARELYWDQMINTKGFRAAQYQLAYQRMFAYSGWFSRERSEISGRIYTLAWIVGAGKTLAIPALAFAFNHMMRQTKGCIARRCRRILVLAKDLATLDQLHYAIPEDLFRFGIVDKKPKMGRGKDHALCAHLHRFDIVCATFQSMWEVRGRETDRIQIFDNFDIITHDEPHFGQEQVLNLVREATDSIYTGLTGTPIEATGEVAKHFVLFSHADQEFVNQNDYSLKFCSLEDRHLPDILEVLTTKQVSLSCSGIETIQGNSAGIPHFMEQGEPVRSVADRVVSHVLMTDAMTLPDNFATISDEAHEEYRAPHRQPTDRVEIDYPVHAMIVVGSKDAAVALEDHLNQLFESNRILFPREMGYAAAYVATADSAHAEQSAADTLGRKRKKQRRAGSRACSEDRPLTRNHPWFRSYQPVKNGGLPRLDAECCRFLIVVGMAREGVDNPFCCVVGVACDTKSIIEHIQRVIGRQLRAYTRWREKNKKRLLVPLQRKDAIKIIVHETFGVTESVKKAIDYICNMQEWLADLPDVQSLMEGSPVPLPPGGVNTGSSLSLPEKLFFVEEIGKAREQAIEVDPEVIASRSPRTRLPSPERTQALEWIQTVLDRPEEASLRLHHTPIVDPVSIPMWEEVSVIPSDTDLLHLIQCRWAGKLEQSQLAASLKDPATRLALTKLYEDQVKACHVSPFDIEDTLESIMKDIEGRLFRELRAHYKQVHPSVNIHSAVRGSIRRLFGVPKEDVAGEGTIYAQSNHKYYLLMPETRRRIMGAARYTLLRAGNLPYLNLALHPGS